MWNNIPDYDSMIRCQGPIRLKIALIHNFETLVEAVEIYRVCVKGQLCHVIRKQETIHFGLQVIKLASRYGRYRVIYLATFCSDLCNYNLFTQKPG